MYQILPGIKLKNALLIIASLVFYAYGEPVYVLLMIGSTILNWLFSVLIDSQKLSSKHLRKVSLALAVIINIAFLVVFKYAGFVIESINAAFSTQLPIPEIALPIGISFYTFQALSYVIDVYRGEVKAQKNYFRVLLYISFFPQLIAGPIVKYHDISAQLEDRSASIDDITCGLRRFSCGLAKKVLIANVMGQIVDSIYAASGSQINIAVAWIAALCYIMQIYFDFSGYSDMAIGMARMFGFHFLENFNYPYFSKSIKEFWRRWHISLSTWFRDYLYIPLGGNRAGKVRTSLNKIIVFATCGLWHGANWTFLIWGLGHGLLLLLEDVLPVKKLPRVFGWIYSILAVTILFVIFRADNLDQALFMIQQMFFGWSFSYDQVSFALLQLGSINILTFIIALFLCFGFGKWVKNICEKKFEKSSIMFVNVFSIFVNVCSIALILLCVLSLASGGYNPFIYFRF